MKVAVFSDSHGELNRMLAAAAEQSPDLIIHLGDFHRDSDSLREKFPRTAVKAVRGNCDFGSAGRESDIFFCGAAKLFITHGHLYGVKNGLTQLKAAALDSGADIVLFGHTHAAWYECSAGTHLMNPGPSGSHGKKSFGIIEISENGGILCRIEPFSF